MSTEHDLQAARARAGDKTLRKEIYVGKPLRDVIQGKKHSLSSLVNSIAERYIALVVTSFAGTTVRMDDVYRATMAEHDVPLSVEKIRIFPELVVGWCERNPMTNDENHHAAAIHHVKQLNFDSLVSLIDRIERTGEKR